ncbi:hypothetical protein FBY06_109114 [Pseudomonas sp. SJZ085]|nr:hypothetical protein FBX99_10849 [Pseudomonas sp. SJZ074]TWC38458.1 hypothetical protein FBY06_109114 [Pseudomonas sp. SJZ085]
MGQKLSKALADANGADRIRIAPEEQHWHTQLSQSQREVGAIVEKPPRQRRVGGSKGRAPIVRVQIRHIHPARGDGQYQVSDQLGAFKRCKHSDDTAHGLRNQRCGSVDLGQDASRQIFHTGYARCGRRVSKAGPADMNLLRWVGQAFGNRMPESGVA